MPAQTLSGLRIQFACLLLRRETDILLKQLETPTIAFQPGETVVLWGTGLGPITGSDATTPPTGNLQLVQPQCVCDSGLPGFVRHTKPHPREIRRWRTWPGAR